MWLICRTAFVKGKNKLLVRGVEGVEWVFCPMIKNMKRDRVNIESCRGCRHFICFEQTYIPQTHITRKTLSFKTIALKDSFHVMRTLNSSEATRPSFTLYPRAPNLINERQPLVDIFEEEDHLIVLVELPSIDEKDIKINADENTVTISADTPKKKYLEKVQLPTPIEKDKIKFTYRNGILKVTLGKLRYTP